MSTTKIRKWRRVLPHKHWAVPWQWHLRLFMTPACQSFRAVWQLLTFIKRIDRRFDNLNFRSVGAKGYNLWETSTTCYPCLKTPSSTSYPQQILRALHCTKKRGRHLELGPLWIVYHMMGCIPGRLSQVSRWKPSTPKSRVIFKSPQLINKSSTTTTKGAAVLGKMEEQRPCKHAENDYSIVTGSLFTLPEPPVYGSDNVGTHH